MTNIDLHHDFPISGDLTWHPAEAVRRGAVRFQALGLGPGRAEDLALLGQSATCGGSALGSKTISKTMSFFNFWARKPFKHFGDTFRSCGFSMVIP